MRFSPLILGTGLSLALGAPLKAQEFEIILDEPAATATSALDLSFSLTGYNNTILGTTTSGVSGQMSAASNFDLTGLGFIDWAATLDMPDVGTGATPVFTLERLSLQNSAGNFSWKLGKYRIGWGEVEGAPVLDVINSGLDATSFGSSSSTLPGQWFAGLDYFGDSYSISGFVNLAPEVNHTLPAAPQLARYEAGARVNIPLSNGVVKFYAARLLPQSGVVDMSSFTSSAVPYTLLGISANRAAGDFLLEFDLAAKSGLQRSTLAGLSPHTRIDGALGVEYAASNSTRITAALIGQHWTEQNATYYIPDPLFGPPIATAQDSFSYMLGLTSTQMSEKLDLSANLAGSPDGSLGIIALSAGYKVSDALSISGAATYVHAASGTQFAPLNGAKMLSIGAKWQF